MNSKKRPHCKCPAHMQKMCKNPKDPNCAEIEAIVRALTSDEQIAAKKSKPPPKLKLKDQPFSDMKCIPRPMTPSMAVRMRYIGHCPVETPDKSDKRNEDLEFDSSTEPTSESASDDDDKKKKKKKKKKVRYNDRAPTKIVLPTPKRVIKHTESDKSILNVPSPKESGEVIDAQRTEVVPYKDCVPPVPPDSGYEVFKPHSGIFINKDDDYEPEDEEPTEPQKTSDRPKRPCEVGGVCDRKVCHKKKCRKYQARRKRNLARSRRLKKSHSMPYSGMGVTDGKPRARGAKRHHPDDDSQCGLDEIPRPEHVQIPRRLRDKKGALETHSLTVIPCSKDKKEMHYGILTGTCNMYDAKFSPRSKGRQALTMSVMAYCLAFHYHPKQWTTKLIDHLVDAGDQWYLQSLDKIHDHSSIQGMCEVLPFGKKQILVLNRKRMQVLLGEPEIVGYTLCKDPTVYSLCRGLKAFFTDNRAGILLTRVLKVVIWRDKICYYIFDSAGRDSKAYSNYTKGCSAIMNVSDLDSVADIVLARTIVEDQKFVLAPVKVLRMVDEKDDDDFESDKELTQAEKAMMGYRILNENCAIVNANMHLGDRCFEEAKFRQALPIAVVAMTYAKISPPNTWTTKTMDKILRLGNKQYVQSKDPKQLIDLSIDNIPNEITIGPYDCEIIIYRERIKGQLFITKDCFYNIKTGLEEFFNHEYNSAIVEFNNYALAIWRQKDMFYLFDPYPRTNDGLRCQKSGRACNLMLLNPETTAEAFKKNWDYLPATTPFVIHAFKVLKLKKKQKKTQIVCTLSDEDIPGAGGNKSKRRPLPGCAGSQGDTRENFHDVHADDTEPLKDNPHDGHVEHQHPKNLDEEHLGDIISLVDSIQEDYVPRIPQKYKNKSDELQDRVVNLDSPTVSVTQVVPPWPKPRDKTNEPPEPDPDPDPTPPPTPPPVEPGEGGEAAEEEAAEEEEEDDEDEEGMSKRKEEQARRKAEEEEARRKAEELPPPLPPPPPSPQAEPEPEVPLADPQKAEDEVQTMEPVEVDRKILLAEDAERRSKMRKQRSKVSPPLVETRSEVRTTPSEELAKDSNFKDLPDGAQILKGTKAIPENEAVEVLPFTAIMAIVTSYKYSINTWTEGIVDFVVDTSQKLCENKKEKFQLASAHVIPKIAIGHQAYQANIDALGEGPTWQLEDMLTRKFFPRYDRGMITTHCYSAAFFKKNGLYYLFDGSTCNPMGVREIGEEGKEGKACFLRFKTIHEMVVRILHNKDSRTEDSQYVLSRILVRKLQKDPRMKLPEDYDYATRKAEDKKSKSTIVEEDKDKKKESRSKINAVEPKNPIPVGYQQVDGGYRIEGTTALTDREENSEVKPCHFVCLIAMLQATMHPIRTWDHQMVDSCLEKGMEVYDKASNKNVCEKRVVKNVLLDQKFIDVNIKKIIIVNKNKEKKLEQSVNAIMKRLRYVIIRHPENNMVICQAEGYYHLFDPYPPPEEKRSENNKDKDEDDKCKKGCPVATWSLHPTLDGLIRRIKKVVKSKPDTAEFYTFELTSVKSAPRHAALNYRLSPYFKPDTNPNQPYLKRKRPRPLVDEKMYWLNVETIPWSRMNPTNDLGFERKTPKTMWKDWDIEFPGDLYSLWGTVHPLDSKFDEETRGDQYLATCVVAAAMTQSCSLSAWTSGFLDGIVNNGDKYHAKCVEKLEDKQNHELTPDDLLPEYDEMYPYKFKVKFESVVFGFLYNHIPDRFNLSKALSYFFEKYTLGILVSPTKNLAFGKIGISYFMYDCQSHSMPLFSPGQGSSYILKCESLNRLIYCMTVTMNIKKHGHQFHLYSADVTLSEKSK